MENKPELNLEISPADVEFVKSYIKPKFHPVQYEEVVYQLALFKTQEHRKRQVKLYHPDCEYKVDDLIYKEYPGKLPVGGKKFAQIPEGVILKVEELRTHFGSNEIRLSYDGTSDFRKYAEYLKRQKIDLLLPHKQKKSPREAEYLSQEIDPRSQEAPLVERDFTQLKKKLAIALNKDNEIVFLSNMVMLKKNLKEIKPEVYDNIKQFLRTNLQSEKTEFLVENFIHVEPNSADFPAYCFSLNHNLLQNHKIDLQPTDSRGWGKWHLISVLYQMKKTALVNEANPLLASVQHKNKKNFVAKKKWLEESLFSEGENRYYLTQREISSGAIRLRAPLLDLGDSIEVEIIDNISKKVYTTYYYKNEHLLLGLEKILDGYRAIQGTIVILEYDENQKLVFTIKTTKKGIITEKILYVPEKQVFHACEEKIASSVFVNKSIFLEPDVFNTIESRIDEFRHIDSYNKLIHKIFLEFGVRERNYEIHMFRLYHILDLVFPIDLKMIGEIIFSNAEFIPSEKVAGVFYLDSDAVIEIEEEEKKRRQLLIEESKRKREELRRLQQEDELKKKEDIRKLREERKRKREDEMRLLDTIRIEREQHKEESIVHPPAGRRAARTRDIPGSVEMDKEFTPQPPPEGAAKPETGKKPKKKFDIEKPLKPVRKGQKKILEEKIELSEIKKEILAEEISRIPGSEEEKRDTVKETQVAYQDKGGFGGILASKLEELVGKEKKDSGKSKKKEKK